MPINGSDVPEVGDEGILWYLGIDQECYGYPATVTRIDPILSQVHFLVEPRDRIDPAQPYAWAFVPQ